MASTDCQREGQATVELGAKFDLSPNSEGYGRIEKISFAAYNESVPVIIWNDSWQIRYTGPGKTEVIARSKGFGYQVQSWADQTPQHRLKKQEYQHNIDRIEVERTLSLSKRCYGMNCITTKLEETQLTSIA